VDNRTPSSPTAKAEKLKLIRMAQAAVLDKLERGEQLKRDGIIIRTWDLMKTYVMAIRRSCGFGIDIEIKKASTSRSWTVGSGKSTLMTGRCLDTPTSVVLSGGKLVSDMTMTTGAYPE